MLATATMAVSNAASTVVRKTTDFVNVSVLDQIESNARYLMNKIIRKSSPEVERMINERFGMPQHVKDEISMGIQKATSLKKVFGYKTTSVQDVKHLEELADAALKETMSYLRKNNPEVTFSRTLTEDEKKEYYNLQKAFGYSGYENINYEILEGALVIAINMLKAEQEFPSEDAGEEKVSGLPQQPKADPSKVMVSPTVKVTEDKMVKPENGLLFPVTFSKKINADGSIVGEENNQSQQTIISQFISSNDGTGETNPYIAMNMKPNTDNRQLISKYPALKEVDNVIKGLGCDATMIQRPDSLVEVMVFRNNRVDNKACFTVDVTGAVLNDEPKWFNAFKPATDDFTVFCAISVNNTEVLKKYINGEANITYLKQNALFNKEYLTVNGFVDLRTSLKNINTEDGYKVVRRLHNALKKGVFDKFKGQSISRFIITDYANPASYKLVSDGHVLVIGSNNMKWIS